MKGFGADFAVSAPYQEGGAVYIYYGKDSSGDGIIVNATEQQVNWPDLHVKEYHTVDCDHCGLCDQVITAEQIVSQLTSLDSLTSFGYTLNGQFDVDNNKYRGMSHKANTTAVKQFWIIM